MTPELKSPSVSMPFNGMSQTDYASKMLNEYELAGVAADQVWPQSFNRDDVLHWVNTHPEFAAQAVYLDGRDAEPGFDPSNAQTWSPSMAELVNQGIEVIAPPIWMLLDLDNNNQIVPSAYAKAANEAGLKIIAWSLSALGRLRAVAVGTTNQSPMPLFDGVMMQVLDVLAQDVGVIGVFSDWPATTTYYANCKLANNDA